ncbi:F-box associated interaction domain-containing protein [Artemisia annua]|uniref:F-box associated interaction domain-containing protein n=1 Tax=Artemisia annua TaxID=35608 RepID=A0A2U1PHV7_ARTAN|nr:F-box associated interaction domain-containing protein [Artemisia annua]
MDAYEEIFSRIMSWQSNFWMALELRNAEIFPNDVYAGEVIVAAKSFARMHQTQVQNEDKIHFLLTFPQMTTESFPPEIIREILLKASVKSLLRCKSVCKDWYSLISDHHFIKKHYSLSSTNNINYKHHRLIYNTPGKDLYSCPLYDVLFDESVVNNALQLENPLQRTRSQRVSIIGSCNGLLCILVTDDNTLFIYNPSTRTTNILPPSKQVVSALRFSYGFGYDETNHDYKVVKLWRCEQPSPPYWDTLIYSLKAGSWKAIGRFPFVNPFNDGMFLNGALHWANGYATWTSQDIVALDLGKKTYSEVLQPEYDEGRKRLTLGVFGEWLSVFCNYYEKRVVDVWVMKVYGVKDSWTKLLSIPHLSDRNSVPLYMKIHAPLCTSNDGKLLLHLGTKLVVYDCINGSCSVIENTHKFRDACIVVESLISPFAPLGLGDNNGDEN